MIVITGTVRIPPENLERARPGMKAMVEATRAEDGCLHYAFAEDVLEPGVIWVSESWRDGEAVGRHAASAHMAAWRAAGADLGIHAPDLTVYEAVSSRPL
jgi:quinol monooxygenase YgiN